MKHNVTTYAKALAELIAEKKLSEKEIVTRFLAFLEKKGMQKKGKEIVRAAEAIVLKKSGYRSIVVQTARKIQKNNMLQTIANKGDIIVEKINPDLVAGVTITVNNEKRLDFSLKSVLDTIFND